MLYPKSATLFNRLQREQKTGLHKDDDGSPHGKNTFAFAEKTLVDVHKPRFRSIESHGNKYPSLMSRYYVGNRHLRYLRAQPDQGNHYFRSLRDKPDQGNHYFRALRSEPDQGNHHLRSMMDQLDQDNHFFRSIKDQPDQGDHHFGSLRTQPDQGSYLFRFRSLRMQPNQGNHLFRPLRSEPHQGSLYLRSVRDQPNQGNYFFRSIKMQPDQGDHLFRSMRDLADKGNRIFRSLRSPLDESNDSRPFTALRSGLFGSGYNVRTLRTTQDDHFFRALRSHQANPSDTERPELFENLGHSAAAPVDNLNIHSIKGFDFPPRSNNYLRPLRDSNHYFRSLRNLVLPKNSKRYKEQFYMLYMPVDPKVLGSRNLDSQGNNGECTSGEPGPDNPSVV